ncbi:hypothetical protein [Streptomyces sp. NPDC127112]|uniref:hypothetical protein n=1 Tax=Streptomyces sp. NPDC127112 TaxID=3345364 RepID=UPI00362C23C8
MNHPITFYYLPDCPPCEKTKPEALRAAMDTGRDILFVNARTRAPEALADLGVTSAPTICNGTRQIRGGQTYDRLTRFFEESPSR